MPAPAKLVTLTQAKAHLHSTIPDGDPTDVALQDLLNEAEASILDYLKDTPDRATWIDPTTAPGPVTAAIKILLGHLEQDRGDGDPTAGIEIWSRIDVLLARFHVTGIA